MADSKDIVLISGTANQPLAEKIAKYLQTPLWPVEISHFKDSETYVRIGRSVRGKQVFIIQPTSKDVNSNLMELIILIDAAKRASAGHITAVIPYYGYARQDRKAKPREPITAKLVANIIAAAGADRVLTLDLHSDQIQGFFNVPLDHFYAIAYFAEYFREKKLDFGKTAVVATDAGGSRRARKLAKILNTPMAVIDKRRDKPNEVAEMRVIGDVKGKDCVVIDDIIDTAGTISEAAKALKGQGANDIYVCATHGVFSDPAFERLADDSIKEVVVTDTIALPEENLLGKIKVISVASLLGEAVKLIYTKESMEVLDNFFKGFKA